MKTLRLLLITGILVSVYGLNLAFGQWSYSGVDIYNTNAGNVGIGNNAPGTLLYVAKNMGEPTITIRNLGGGGGATYSMVDDLSGADWKFKATTFGGFKIRDHANSLDVIVIEPGSAANMIYIKAGGNMGIGMNVPEFKLDVSADARINGVRIGRGGGNNVNNTTVGYQAFSSNSSGIYNTAVGNHALFDNTTGYRNTAVGHDALRNTTTGSYNTACGTWALNSNVANSRSTAIGYQAMYYADNQPGGRSTYNTAVGYEALKGSSPAGNNTGRFNTALGDEALWSNTEGESNTASGRGALRSNTEGDYNSAYGVHALYSNTTGNKNTAMGRAALYNNVANSRSTAIGYQAMFYADDQPGGRETYNTAVGSEALKGSATAGNNTGQYNTAVGDQALFGNTSGYYNTACGYYALYSNMTGIFNSAGGEAALRYNTGGNHNTAFGIASLYYNTSGSYNTGLGRRAGVTNVTGNYLTCVGNESDVQGTLTNAMALGNGAIVNTSNKVVIGNTGVTSIGGYEPWTDFSDGRYKKNIREDVPGLDFIRQLRPVTYTLDITSLDANLHKNRPAILPEDKQSWMESPEYRESVMAKEQIVYTGFVAQEVEQVAKGIGYDFRGVDAPQQTDGFYGLRYAEFVAPLVKAIQEQQAMIEELQRKVEELEAERGRGE
ncbi:MAG TPA: tail fiber domain-containing protein [Bacteroidales bacterium]|nr:tail fiber domain-containing protein [Bacteroidales bacterium]HNS46063.1 tail fiber domain-containing protein [Bacteroidales bacterium]